MSETSQKEAELGEKGIMDITWPSGQEKGNVTLEAVVIVNCQFNTVLDDLEEGPSGTSVGELF